jgi:hypothetical protein
MKVGQRFLLLAVAVLICNFLSFFPIISTGCVENYYYETSTSLWSLLFITIPMGILIAINIVTSFYKLLKFWLVHGPSISIAQSCLILLSIANLGMEFQLHYCCCCFWLLLSPFFTERIEFLIYCLNPTTVSYLYQSIFWSISWTMSISSAVLLAFYWIESLNHKVLKTKKKKTPKQYPHSFTLLLHVIQKTNSKDLSVGNMLPSYVLWQWISPI